jgi:hypothetical protein
VAVQQHLRLQRDDEATKTWLTAHTTVAGTAR